MTLPAGERGFLGGLEPSDDHARMVPARRTEVPFAVAGPGCGMAELRDAELSCPRCGAQMSRGFINAGKGPMRWVTRPDENKTILGGERLVKQQGVWGRHVVPAARCETCRVGVFAYDPSQ